MTDYFNTYEFTKAKKLIETDPYEAITRLENYIEKYPKDYNAYTYLAGALAYITKLDDAQKIINQVQKLASINNSFNKSESRLKRFIRDINFVQLKIWAYKSEYSKAYNYCKNHQVDIEDLSLLNYEFYLRYKLNKVKHERISSSYLFNQMVSYNEEDFLNHIKKHMYSENDDFSSDNVFFANVDILNLLNEIKKYIPSDKIFYPGFYEDLYVFRYDRCGKEKNKTTDFIKVYAFHDTTDLITILPASSLDNMPYVDLNYMIENDNANVKRLSQIDRFNKRFNLK